MNLEKANEVSRLLSELQKAKADYQQLCKTSEFTVIKITGEDGCESEREFTFGYRSQSKLTKKVHAFIREEMTKNILELTQKIEEQ